MKMSEHILELIQSNILNVEMNTPLFHIRQAFEHASMFCFFPYHQIQWNFL